MSVKTSRAIACDNCSTELPVTGLADEWGITAAEAGWHQFRTTYRRGVGVPRRSDVYACPGCPPRAAAEKVRGRLAAEAEAERDRMRASWDDDNGHDTGDSTPQ